MTAGVLLAAGLSSRMGGDSKLLLPVRGKPLVRWPAEALLEAGLAPVVVVLGRESVRVRGALAGLDLRFVENPQPERGMGLSLAAGVGGLGPEVRAAAVALGDMPGVTAAIVRQLEAAFRTADRGIAVPVRKGRRGHPVLFDLTRYRSALLCLTGDAGARSILRAHPEDVLEVPVDDPGVLLDVDTEEDYRGLEG